MEDVFSLHPNGLFLRREAREFGVDDRQLREAVAENVIVKVRHGTYVDAKVWGDASLEERYDIRGQGVLMRHGHHVALSHTSGAAALGLRLWEADLRRVHVTRLDGGHAHIHGDVVYHAGEWSPDDIYNVGDHLVMSPVRSALGTAALHSVEAGVVVLDSLLDLGLAEPAELTSTYDAIKGNPGTARLQVTVRLAQPGAQSVGESRVRFLCWRAHLPKPELQYQVWYSGKLVGITDFAWPEHRLLGEFDGMVKYLRLLRTGERSEDAVVREKKREDALREVTGFGMIRFIWVDLGRPHVTEARLRHQLSRNEAT
jgi:hypothetical protein